MLVADGALHTAIHTANKADPHRIQTGLALRDVVGIRLGSDSHRQEKREENSRAQQAGQSRRHVVRPLSCQIY